MTYWNTYQSRKDVPIICGIYVIYKDNKIIYIGASKNIRKRFSNHNVVDWDYCKIKPTTSFGAAHILEEKLIKRIKPSLNAYMSNRAELGNRHRVEVEHDIYVRFRDFCNAKGLKIKQMTNDILQQFLRAVEDSNAKQV